MGNYFYSFTNNRPKKSKLQRSNRKKSVRFESGWEKKDFCAEQRRDVHHLSNISFTFCIDRVDHWTTQTLPLLIYWRLTLFPAMTGTNSWSGLESTMETKGVEYLVFKSGLLVPNPVFVFSERLTVEMWCHCAYSTRDEASVWTWTLGAAGETHLCAFLSAPYKHLVSTGRLWRILFVLHF